MGEVLQFNRHLRSARLFRLSPTQQIMPTDLLVVKAFSEGVYFDQEAFDLIRYDRRSTFLAPVEVIQVSSTEMDIPSDSNYQNVYEVWAEGNNCGFLNARIILEWVHAGKSLPKGSFYTAFGDHSRLLIENTDIGGRSIKCESASQQVIHKYDWFWLSL